MSRRWETGRTDGRECLIIDPEDGSHPQRVYGADRNEVLEKLANTVEHSARHIAVLKSGGQRPANAPPVQGAAPPLTAPRKPMSADERMQRTADLSNPAKSTEAIVALADEATGGVFSRITAEERRRAAVDHFATVAGAWTLRHPEFPSHPANKRMLADAVALRVGLQNATEAVLDTVYAELSEGGFLIQDQAPAGQPEENPAPRPAPGSATSYRRTSLRGSTPPPAQTYRYTRAQIDAMSADEFAKKYGSDAEFRKAFDAYTQPRQATA